MCKRTFFLVLETILGTGFASAQVLMPPTFKTDFLFWKHDCASISLDLHLMPSKYTFNLHELDLWGHNYGESDLSSWQGLTLKALWDGEGSVVAGAGHRVATPVIRVQTIEGNMLSMEDSVGFQVCDPELLGIVEDAASFDANCAGSWVEKQSS